MPFWKWRWVLCSGRTEKSVFQQPLWTRWRNSSNLHTSCSITAIPMLLVRVARLWPHAGHRSWRWYPMIRSAFEEAIACWRGEKREWLNQLVRNAHNFDFPVHKPYRQLTRAQQNWCGATPIWRHQRLFGDLEQDLPSKTASSWRAVNNTTCSECKGGRLRIETTYIKVADRHIGELINMPIDELLSFSQNETFGSRC